MVVVVVRVLGLIVGLVDARLSMLVRLVFRLGRAGSGNRNTICCIPGYGRTGSTGTCWG